MNPQSTISLQSGNEMPALGFGTWQCTNDTPGAIEAALALGYRLIDTSGDYGTQPGIGEGIKRSGLARDEFYLVTKVEEDDADAFDATQKNLAELQLEFADLILIHRPPVRGVGEELWRGLIKAREDGLTRDIGVSNYSQEQIDELIALTGETPAVNQIEWSPFGYSEAMFHYAKERNLVIQAYSPLTRTRRLDDERLFAIASEHDKTPAQVLIRWNLERGTVPLPKANQREHAVENIDVFDFSLSEEDMAELDNLNERYSSLGTLAYK